MDELASLRQAVATEGRALATGWLPWLERQDYAESAENLACYLTLRQHDLRALQSALMPFGLSSLEGLPSRGEMTDAAMSVRAEAVMQNKGPHLVEGVEALDRLLNRIHDHQDKKTPKLRALRSCQPEISIPEVNPE